MSLKPGLRKQNLALSVDCKPRPDDEQLSRSVWPGADQSVPECGGACLSGRRRRRGRNQGAGSRRRSRRDPVHRQRRRHEPRTCGDGRSIRSSRRAATRAAPALACTSSTASSPTVSADVCICIPSRAGGRGSRSSCRATRRWSWPRSKRGLFGVRRALRSVARKIWLCLADQCRAVHGRRRLGEGAGHADADRLAAGRRTAGSSPGLVCAA